MERQSKVLVVDDDPFALQSIAKVLEGESYQVVTAVSGSEALDLLKQESFDLVLTDLKMPEVDGLEVLRQAREIVPQAVVLILIGCGSLESAVETLREGARESPPGRGAQGSGGGAAGERGEVAFFGRECSWFHHKRES